MATNHVSVAIGQVPTTSLPRYSHYFFPTTLFLVIMTRCYFSLCMHNDHTLLYFHVVLAKKNIGDYTLQVIEDARREI